MNRYSRERISELITASLADALTPQQSEELEAWLSENQANRTLFDQLSDEEYVDARLARFRAADTEGAWARVAAATGAAGVSAQGGASEQAGASAQAKTSTPAFGSISDTGNQSKKDTNRRGIMHLLPYAAAAVVLFAAAFNIVTRITQQAGQQMVTIVAADVTPGTSKANLILETGRTVKLGGGQCAINDPYMEGVLFDDGNQLIYRLDSRGPVKWHELVVPQGGEYKVVFSDGSSAILNSGSRIRYPSRFDGGERRVELWGEAYFDVTTDRENPFVVDNGDVDVRVYGTSFNLRAYPDQRLQTTLVSGEVVIDCNREKMVLNPGERVTRAGDSWEKRNVDVDAYKNWKAERFIFDDELIEEVLRKLERWYDINVYITSPSLREIRFTGNLPKYEDIDKTLGILELTTHIRFNRSGRILLVEKEKEDISRRYDTPR